MGCAVQIHQNSERRASWATNTIDRNTCQTNEEQQNVRYGVLQIKIHHPTHLNSSRRHHQSIDWPNASIKRKEQWIRLRTDGSTEETQYNPQQPPETALTPMDRRPAQRRVTFDEAVMHRRRQRQKKYHQLQGWASSHNEQGLNLSTQPRSTKLMATTKAKSYQASGPTKPDQWYSHW